jgi:hypothetical protein
MGRRSSEANIRFKYQLGERDHDAHVGSRRAITPFVSRAPRTRRFRTRVQWRMCCPHGRGRVPACRAIRDRCGRDRTASKTSLLAFALRLLVAAWQHESIVETWWRSDRRMQPYPATPWSAGYRPATSMTEKDQVDVPALPRTDEHAILHVIHHSHVCLSVHSAARQTRRWMV